jgi:hypothetical protein
MLALNEDPCTPDHPKREPSAARVEEELLTGNVKVIVNLNAFAILPENKRVDIDIDIAVVAIAIADNIVKNNYINILPQSLATYLYYII